MADTNTTQEITKPDIQVLLNGLAGWVEQKKQASQVPMTETGKPWGWVVGAVVSLAAVIGLAILAWKAWKRGQEIAKLKHQVDVDTESKHQAEVNAKLHQDEATQKALQEQAEQLRQKIVKTGDEIVKIETERKKLHYQIDRVTTWEDVDKLIDEVTRATS